MPKPSPISSEERLTPRLIKAATELYLLGKESGDNILQPSEAVLAIYENTGRSSDFYLNNAEGVQRLMDLGAMVTRNAGELPGVDPKG